MISNKKLHPVVAELFIRGRKSLSLSNQEAVNELKKFLEMGTNIRREDLL